MVTFIAAPHIRGIDRPGTRQARIVVEPAWVGLIDFDARLPSANGGVRAREQVNDHAPNGSSSPSPASENSVP